MDNTIIIINESDELFPSEFTAIGEDCPSVIYAMGNLDLLKSGKKVAVIGSRKPRPRASLRPLSWGRNMRVRDT